MHSVTREWPAVPEWRAATIRSGATAIKVSCDLFQTAVSGKVDSALGRLDLGGRVGFWEVAAGDTYAVSIARDKVLVISPRPIALAEGWSGEGWAAIRADDATIVFELDGPGLGELMSEMGLVVDGARSPSAAVMVAGVQVLVYRVGEGTARLHVPASFAPFLWEWIAGRDGAR